MEVSTYDARILQNGQHVICIGCFTFVCVKFVSLPYSWCVLAVAGHLLGSHVFSFVFGKTI